jgi:DNA-binding response OmpR family regulator
LGVYADRENLCSGRMMKQLEASGVLDLLGLRTFMGALQVLLVEDNAGDALLVGQTLADAPLAIKLHIARDGVQALQMLSTFKPDLIILDLILPELPGFDLMKRYHPADVPLVIFSGSNKESDKLLAKASGASDYVVKPSDLQVFRKAILGIIERWGGRTEDTAAAK